MMRSPKSLPLCVWVALAAQYGPYLELAKKDPRVMEAIAVLTEENLHGASKLLFATKTNE